MKLIIFLQTILCLCIMASSQGSDPPYIKEASTFSNTEQRQYEYIIVGGGTAGCPLAATLSQNFKVLVLERGGSPYGNINISRLENARDNLINTSPQSPSQPFVSTDGVSNFRARVLGGGTCINGGYYSRASRSFIRRAGWDLELVRRSYEWVEEKIVHRPQLRPWQEAFKNGLIQAGVLPFNGFTLRICSEPSKVDLPLTTMALGALWQICSGTAIRPITGFSFMQLLKESYSTPPGQNLGLLKWCSRT